MASWERWDGSEVTRWERWDSIEGQGGRFLVLFKGG